VGLVLLSGDVVDRANRYFEGFGRLEEGVRRLTEAGIEVCAVAGNHDYDVLPRLVEAVGGERCRLLGAGGSWQRWSWREPGGEVLLHVDGWSFPGKNVREDPVARYDLAPPGDDAPLLGLVHGDLGQPASTNAPLARASLERAGPAAWLLGHVHKPELFELAGGRWALYPGSPQPCDPTEQGPHGAWLLEIEGGRLGRPTPVPLATVRWLTLELDLSGVEEVEAAEDRIARAVREAASDLAASGPGAVEWLLLRAVLTGRTGAFRDLPGLARRLEEDDPLELAAGDGRARLVEVRVAARPAVELATLARGEGPPALLAELLLTLERSPPEPAAAGIDGELLARVETRLGEVHGSRPYADLEDAPAGPPSAAGHVVDAARSLLDALLAQKEELRGPEPPA
ncbi:MAG TPA: metallophosphoesterase family protein, partial [Thermoanaerobaculia bacterium]|nr:metallophosphoesterase family protein [Thermoanaerobaculia bacterium]